MWTLLWASLALGQDPPAEPVEPPPPEVPAAVATPPALLEAVPAVYPAEARRQRIEGTVHLEVDVGADGAVTDARVTTGVHPLLDAAALEAARRLRFSPATLDGEPVADTVAYRFLFTLGSSEAGAVARPATLHARVVDSDDLDVPGATIRLVREGGGEEITRESGPSGRFSVATLPPGKWKVILEHRSFQPAMYPLDLSAGETLELDLVMTPTDSNDVVVWGIRETWREVARGELAPDEGTVTGVYELSRRDIESTPGSLEDIARAAHALPGVVADGDLMAGFHVRGGEQDEVVFLLDRVPLENPFHLGGFNSLFNPDMISRVQFFSGTPPASVPAGTSAVMSVESWDGSPGEESTGLDGAVDVSASSLRAHVLGSLDRDDKLTVALAARRTYLEGYFQVLKWIDVIDSAFAAPEYSELSARLAWRPDAAHRLMVTALQSGDSLALIDSDDESLVNFSGTFELKNRLTLLSADHRYQLGDTTWQTTAAYTRDRGYIRRDLAGSIEQEQTLHRGFVRSDWLQRLGDNELGIGADFSVFSLDSSGTVEDNRAFPTWGQAGLAELGWDAINFGSRQPWVEGSVYANAELRGPVRVRAGARGTWAGLSREFLVSPRVGLSVPLPTGTIPKVSAGIYYQLPRNPRELDDGIGNPDLRSERARSVVVGIDQGFPLPGEGSGGLVRVEAYWTELDRLIVTPDSQVAVDAGPAYDNLGTGRNRGIDVMIGARAGVWNVHATYGLLFADRDNPSNERWPSQVDPPQDQRHTLGLAGDVSVGGHWRFTGRYAFHSGRPISRVVLASAEDETVALDCLNCERLGPTHTIDLRAEWRRAYRRYRLTFYLELLNVGNINSDFLPIHDVIDGEVSTTMLRHLPMRPFLGLRLDF